MRRALLVCALLGSACGGVGGVGVELTVHFAPSISDDALAEVKSLSFTTSGDEAYSKTVALGHTAARNERTVYRPETTSLMIDIDVVALGDGDVVLGEGETGPVKLDDHGIVSVEVDVRTTSNMGADLGPDLGADVAIDAGQDSMPPPSDLASDRYRAAVLADTPVLYYRLDEPLGAQNAIDSSGNGRTGLYFGSYTLANAGALVGDSDTAARFMPSVGGIEVNTTVLATQGNAPWSIEEWINPVAVGTDSSYLYSIFYSNGGNQWLHAFVNSQLGIQVERLDKDGTNAGISTTAPAIGVFTHVVVTYDGSLLHLWKNGLLAESGSSAGPQDTLAAVFYIGAASSSAGAFNGTIDEVAFYDYALDETKIANHYHLGSGL